MLIFPSLPNPVLQRFGAARYIFMLQHSADMDKESIGDDDDKDGMVNDGYDKEPVDLKTTNL